MGGAIVMRMTMPVPLGRANGDRHRRDPADVVRIASVIGLLNPSAQFAVRGSPSAI
ncbi:hypothetical protein [Novosphingobium sp. CF614]|uniref:hypothetical protein n=1 Tax=Novosphingobium sp. CF614 TaxID=1884364 RepID=UPI0015A59B0C|nr:hypothetical protein [Novosphingobium sp. CF614]